MGKEERRKRDQWGKVEKHRKQSVSVGKYIARVDN